MDQPPDPPPAGESRLDAARGRVNEGRELLRPVTPHEFGHPDVTEREFGNRTFFVAEVRPLDVDGVRTMGIGALLWLAAFVAMLPFAPTLAADDRTWWLWTCLTGAVLGLIGWLYCRRRRTYLREHASDVT